MTVTAKKLGQRANPESSAWLESAFQQHWTGVQGLLQRLLQDPDEAQDLAVETFWRLHQRPPAERDPARLGGWLYRVATNLGLNALRARQRRSRYEQEAGHLALEAGNPPDPALEVERAERRTRVQQVLVEMQPRAAQLLLLRHSGYAYAEIAAALGVAPGSVGTLLARAEREFERRYRLLEGGDSHAHP